MRGNLAILVVAMLALGGCIGDEAGGAGGADEETDGTSSSDDNATFEIPPPRSILRFTQTSGDVPTAARPYATDVTIGPSYDRVVVAFAGSGSGTWQLTITQADGAVVYDSGSTVSNNQPDTHAFNNASGTKYEVEPGKLAVVVEWTGIVSFDIEMIQRSSHEEMTDHSQHM